MKQLTETIVFLSTQMQVTFKLSQQGAFQIISADIGSIHETWQELGDLRKQIASCLVEQHPHYFKSYQ